MAGTSAGGGSGPAPKGMYRRLYQQRPLARPAGFYNRELQLQVNVQTQSPSGAMVPDWQTFATVWGNIEPMSAAARFYSQQYSPTVNATVRIRYREDVMPEMQLLFGEHIFVVKSPPRDVQYQHVELLLECEELQATAA